jgi:hypothetical protein
MVLPRRQTFMLPEIAARWNVTMAEFGCLAVDEVLTFSTVVRSVRVVTSYDEQTAEGEIFQIPGGIRHLRGVQQLYGVDIWRAFRGERVRIFRFKPQEPYSCADIEYELDWFDIGLEDILLTRPEIEKYEAANGIVAEVKQAAVQPPTSGTARRPAGPGKSAKHDWDGFHIEMFRNVYENGRPSSQAILVRILMDWFHRTSNQPPDESTVRKKVSRFWHSGVCS